VFSACRIWTNHVFLLTISWNLAINDDIFIIVVFFICFVFLVQCAVHVFTMFFGHSFFKMLLDASFWSQMCHYDESFFINNRDFFLTILQNLQDAPLFQPFLKDVEKTECVHESKTLILNMKTSFCFRINCSIRDFQTNKTWIHVTALDSKLIVKFTEDFFSVLNQIGSKSLIVTIHPYYGLPMMIAFWPFFAKMMPQQPESKVKNSGFFLKKFFFRC